MEYILEKPEEEVTQDSIIEKRGHVIRFSLAQVAQNRIALQKAERELNAQIDLERAKMKNIEEHHDFVLDLTEEELFTAHMYATAKAMLTQCLAKLEEVTTTLSNEDEEVKTIKEQIPGLDVPEPIVIPPYEGGVIDAINEAKAKEEDSVSE